MQHTTPYPDSGTVRSGADALSERVHGGIDRLSSGAHHAVDRAAGAAGVTAGRLEAKGRELVAAGDQWVDLTRACVREHPFTALGVALAAGYLISRMMSR